MLSKKDQSQLRNSLFRHLDGLVVSPTAYTLYEHEVVDYLKHQRKASLTELAKKFKANEGYLNVALRVLCSQGWLVQELNSTEGKITFTLTDKGAVAFNYVHLYREAVDLLKFSEKYHPRKFEVEPFFKLESLFGNFTRNFGLDLLKEQSNSEVLYQIMSHIEGIIVGPTVVHLGMSRMFHKYFMEASFKPEEFHKDPESFRRLLDIFAQLGWFDKKKETYQFSEKGLFFAKRATAYGVTVSYIPTLRKLDELIFGDAEIFKKQESHAPEIHVDREMNVWGSGGAHSSYFKVVDEIIIEMFNRPVNEQPKGIVDMGCGNGAFLQHLFSIIEQHTARGKMLDEYPLFLVGADFNEMALKITKANLIQADIWAKVIWGDVGRPDLLANDLEANYGIDLRDLLNVRTFLDHNRPWNQPKNPDITRKSDSTGAFAYAGRRLGNREVEESLLEHLKNWQPYVSRFGLLVIELHTVPPTLVAANLGFTPATAYDATHGYSDQYILELDIFHKVAAEAGLNLNVETFRKFPNSELATISINLFKGENDEL